MYFYEEKGIGSEGIHRKFTASHDLWIQTAAYWYISMNQPRATAALYFVITKFASLDSWCFSKKSKQY